jgi:hypothetical protein
MIHYINLDHITGLKDSSGVRFYYTNEEREYRAGINDTGDPWVMLENTTINNGLTTYSITCPDACSSTYLTSPMRSSNSSGNEEEEEGGEGGVTILSEMLHVHKTGVRMTNEVIRNGEVYHTAMQMYTTPLINRVHIWPPRVHTRYFLAIPFERRVTMKMVVDLDWDLKMKCVLHFYFTTRQKKS